MGTFEFDVTVQMSEADMARLEELIANDERFKSYSVSIGRGLHPNYAWYLEFGTNPSTAEYKPKDSYRSRGEKSPVLKKYEKWVEGKFQ